MLVVTAIIVWTAQNSFVGHAVSVLTPDAHNTPVTTDRTLEIADIEPVAQQVHDTLRVEVHGRSSFGQEHLYDDSSSQHDPRLPNAEAEEAPFSSSREDTTTLGGPEKTRPPSGGGERHLGQAQHGVLDPDLAAFLSLAKSALEDNGMAQQRSEKRDLFGRVFHRLLSTLGLARLTQDLASRLGITLWQEDSSATNQAGSSSLRKNVGRDLLAVPPPVGGALTSMETLRMCRAGLLAGSGCVFLEPDGVAFACYLALRLVGSLPDALWIGLRWGAGHVVGLSLVVVVFLAIKSAASEVGRGSCSLAVLDSKKILRAIQTNRSRWAAMFPRRFAKYEFRSPSHNHCTQSEPSYVVRCVIVIQNSGCTVSFPPRLPSSAS